MARPCQHTLTGSKKMKHSQCTGGTSQGKGWLVRWQRIRLLSLFSAVGCCWEDFTAEGLASLVRRGGDWVVWLRGRIWRWTVSANPTRGGVKTSSLNFNAQIRGFTIQRSRKLRWCIRVGLISCSRRINRERCVCRCVAGVPFTWEGTPPLFEGLEHSSLITFSCKRWQVPCDFRIPWFERCRTRNGSITRHIISSHACAVEVHTHWTPPHPPLPPLLRPPSPFPLPSSPLLFSLDPSPVRQDWILPGAEPAIDKLLGNVHIPSQAGDSCSDLLDTSGTHPNGKRASNNVVRFMGRVGAR